MEQNIVITNQAGSISCNFDQMKQYLNERLNEYKNAVFTEDSKAAAKKTVAALRSEQKEFKDRIKDVKSEYMKPFDKFKNEADQLVLLYDEPINFINNQVEQYEQKRIAEKKEQIKSIYAENIHGFEEYLPLEKIYNLKWENATYKIKDVQSDITKLVYSTSQATDAIQNMHSEVVDKALAIYKRDLSLTDALTYINNYEIQKAEILRKEQERQKEIELEKAREEERKRIQQEQAHEAEIKEAVEAAKDEVIETMIPEQDEITIPYTYRVYLGDSAKEVLQTYMDSVGIEWEEV